MMENLMQQLCEDWWILNMRRKIYPQEQAHAFNLQCNAKRDDIKKLGQHDKTTTIFEDKEAMKRLNRRLARHGGMPIFKGRTDDDFIYYYAQKSKVRCYYGFKDNTPIIKDAIVLEFDINTKIITVLTAEGATDEMPVKDVTRVF